MDTEKIKAAILAHLNLLDHEALLIVYKIIRRLARK